MSSPFLDKTARHILANYGPDLREICLVLPNRRAGLFFRKYLASGITVPVWSPGIFSVEDFMASLSGLHEADTIQVLADLYDIHRRAEKEKAQPADEFLNWAEQLLSDFNDIDRYLVDARQLFGYLDEVRALTLWNPGQKTLTEFQQNYLKFYHSLYSYYKELTGRLLNKRQGYQGLVFRQAWMNLKKGEATVPWKKILFAGFNALTGAEKEVMLHLYGQGKADFLWDADHFYLDRPTHEAGTFLRQWFSKWPLKEKLWITDDLREGEKEIDIIGAPDAAGQVKYCAHLLAGVREYPDERTAVILPDESLLMPLLNSIPDSLRELNVTMGLPLSQTPVADLFNQIIRMHLHGSDAKKGSGGNGLFFSSDVIRVLQHPVVTRMVRAAAGEKEMQGERVISSLRKSGRMMVAKADIISQTGTGNEVALLEPFFEDWNIPSDLTRDLNKITGLLRDHPGKEHTGGAGNDHLYTLATIVERFGRILEEYPAFFTLQTFCRFFSRSVESTTLPFWGEPLKGVQIMGMLETRTLDFERVIVLSCNEDILPSGKMPHSFIPADIKKEFGLPLIRHKDAVYAYHFYRLLQRARKITLLYKTEPGKLGGGEKSRFLHQLIRELPSWNPGIKIREQLLVVPFTASKALPVIIIQKTGDIPGLLEKKAADGLAPSALNAFRKCPLAFYFSEIAMIKEPDEPEETIDARNLGTGVHKALSKLFGPLLDRPLRKDDLNTMTRMADSAVLSAFTQKYPEYSLGTGRNLLLVKVASLMVKNFLRAESALVEEITGQGGSLVVRLVEQKAEKQMKIPSGNGSFDVRIKGFIDRVDTLGGETRIIDYKTGKTDKKELTVVEWDELASNPLLDKGFQLLTYAWLLGPGTTPGLVAGIIPLIRPGEGLIPVRVPGDQEDAGSAKNPRKLGTGELQRFGDVLEGLVGRIFDLSEPFRQTENPDTCILCVYRSICMR